MHPYSVVVVNRLQEMGYDVCPQVIDFSEYGVPQRRKRFILVGVRNGEKDVAKIFLERLKANRKKFLAKHDLNQNANITEAISDLLRSYGEVDTPDRKGFKSGLYGPIDSAYQRYMRAGIGADVPNSHSFAKHTAEKQALFDRLIKDYPTKGKRIDGKAREKWGIKQRGLFILDGQSVAPTITNMPDDYLHYLEPRIMTVRECARIQSFPDWYEFKSKYTTGGDMRKKEVPRYSQVGNAIPPLFAHQAGLVLKTLI